MAEDVKLVLKYRVEANAPLAYQKPILLMEGDKRANVLQISLFDGEKAVDLAGMSVGGSVLRADGADVAIEGEIDGNVISCVLSEYAYAVAGPFKAFVQLLDSLGDVKRTVLLLAGMVESRGHGPQIDTGKELPSLDDILAQLETMRNVTQAANTAAGGANTAAAAANSAASKATGAANSATTAAGTANAAAGNADAAAARANDAAAEVESGTAPNAEKLGGKTPDKYMTIDNRVSLLQETAVYAVGSTVSFNDSPDNYKSFYAALEYITCIPTSGSGGSGNRKYTLISFLPSSGSQTAALQAYVVRIVGTYGGTDFTVAQAIKYDFPQSGAYTATQLESIRLSAVYGVKY